MLDSYPLELQVKINPLYFASGRSVHHHSSGKVNNMSTRTQQGKLCHWERAVCCTNPGLTWASHSEHKAAVFTCSGVHKMRPLNTLSGREEELMGLPLPKDFTA